MNKQEQSELCKLLAKMRYDIMKEIVCPNITKEYYNKCDELLKAINKLMCYSYIDMKESK